jgi:dolichol-phosphate mannosyltransferase
MERAAGKPKQTMRRLVKYAVDGMVSFSYKPLRVGGVAGFAVSMLSFAAGAVLRRRLLRPAQADHRLHDDHRVRAVPRRVQLIAIGILGEYIGRIYEEIKQRPLYVVAERVGFG